MKKRKITKVPSATSSPGWILTGIGLCAVILSFHFAASFFPRQRFWGINHLAYFPLSIRIIFTILSFSIFIPPVNRGMRTLIQPPLAYLYERLIKDKKYLGVGALSLLSIPLFWLLRAKTYFLGDGFNYVTNLDRGVETRIWSELLESQLHIWWYKLLHLFSPVSAQFAYQTASIVAGAVLVFLLLSLSDYLGKSRFEKFFVFSILVTMGSIQLFLGYVEHYSFTYLSVLAYLLFTLRFLDGHGKFLWVVLLFVLSVAFHFASFYLLLSLAFLLVRDKEGVISKRRIFWLSGGMVLLLGAFFWYVLETKPGLMRIFVLPVEQKFAPGYTLFSSAHLLDILNQSLLVSPVGIILLLLPLLFFKTEVGIRKPRTIFLLAVTVPQLFFHFFLDPGLGAARDWDLFSALSLGYTIWGICLFVKIITRFSAFKYLALVLIFTSLFSTLPWIAVNNSESKSVQRFRDILDLDPKRSRSGHFFLAQYFDAKEMIDEVERENQKQREIYPEVVLLEEGMKYLNERKFDQALSIFQQADHVNPYSPDVHFLLAKTYYLQGSLDSAEKEYRETVKLKPEYVKAHIDLATIYASRGNWKDAIDQYNQVLKLGTKDPAVYSALGKLYLYRNQVDEALKQFKKALSIQPDFIDAHLGAGAVFLKLGRWDDALTEYQKVIQLKPASEDAYIIMSEIYQKMGLKGKAIESLERFLEFSSNPQKSDEVKRTIKSLKETP